MKTETKHLIGELMFFGGNMIILSYFYFGITYGLDSFLGLIVWFPTIGLFLSLGGLAVRFTQIGV